MEKRFNGITRNAQDLEYLEGLEAGLQKDLKGKGGVYNE